MTQELTTLEPHYAVLNAVDVNPTGGRLVAWAEAARAAAFLGAALAKTSFAPQTFRNKPEECAAAILFGDEIGLTPTQSMQSIFVISGRTGMYARAMVAIVLAAGHQIETVIKTDAKVTVRGRRRGSETWIEETWTTERARRAGYTNNKKYETDPQSMLYARAASDICRQIAPDALAGIAYSVEELELADVPTAKVVRSETTAGKTSVRRKAPEPTAPAFDDEAAIAAPEPDDDEPVTVDAETGEILDGEEVDGPASKEQIDNLTEVLRRNGYTNRAMMLGYLIQITGRDDLESAAQLTTSQVVEVLATLGVTA